jgi:hypothetical protein
LKLSLEEENIRSKAMSVLQQYMFVPSKEWQYEVISIVSGFQVNKLKVLFDLAKKQAEEMKEKLKDL